ncbi:aminoacyl-histidine dipeptidase [Parendozoicomonas haliclonae]|uniref:Cytosol non-specific dipeptidase n=1 Tax=Parendozoicomonas haliclonae TaxID=1960125 RepID=A0A1X7AS59_9GAMM|nr:aminoacyl-histidine dipeptidase [Parendozoicomonas haliclonae]SMA50910.1 Cytosol non-specific dipeptidase [Parendozoicomonas haliclonae]
MDITTLLSNTAAAEVWYYFLAISRIPRPSGQEQAIREFIQTFAEQLQLDYTIDNTGNLIVYKPATPGYEQAQPVILQSHLDMVTEMEESSLHNFMTDPLTLHIDNGWLFADQTTLGADNGIGVAASLAILSSQTLIHGPLEALFTVEEETTMAGAEGLDGSLLSGNVLINLDTEELQSLYIGCAGGVNVDVHHCYERQSPPDHLQWFQLKLSGLRGGHSGCDIHLQQGNAIQLLARLLKSLTHHNLHLNSFHGGSADNAIPRQAISIIGFPLEKVAHVQHSIDTFTQQIKNEYQTVEPELALTLQSAPQPNDIISPQDLQNWLNALHSCHHGVKRYSDHFSGVVESSSNLGVANIEQGKITVNCFVRSLIDSATLDLADNLCGLFTNIGATVQKVGLFPGWQPSPDSAVLAIVTHEYERIHQHQPEIKVIHAALECGILGEQKTGLDMISLGPDIENPHTPRERINIASVDPFWQLLTASLARLAG